MDFESHHTIVVNVSCLALISEFQTSFAEVELPERFFLGLISRLRFEFGNSREWALVSEYLEVLEFVEERLVTLLFRALVALPRWMHNHEHESVLLHESKELARLVKVRLPYA